MEETLYEIVTINPKTWHANHYYGGGYTKEEAEFFYDEVKKQLPDNAWLIIRKERY